MAYVAAWAACQSYELSSAISRRLLLSGLLLSTVVTRGNFAYNDFGTRALSSHRQLSAVPRLGSSMTSEAAPLLPRRSTSLQRSATTRHQLPHTKLQDGRGAVRRRLAPDSVIHNEIFSAPTRLLRDQKNSGGMFLGLRLIGTLCWPSHPLHELAHNCTGRSVVFIGDINLVEWPGVVRELFTRPAQTKGPP